LLLVRRFGFSGYIYLKAYGHDHRRVDDVLASKPE
jgi:hypothetical protein